MKATKTSIRKYRDSLRKLNIRKRQLKDAKLAYLRAKKHADAPQFLENLKEKASNKVAELKEKKRIWNELMRQWEAVERISRMIAADIDGLDTAIDDYDKQETLNRATKIESAIKQIRQLAPKLQDVPENFTKIQLK